MGAPATSLGVDASPCRLEPPSYACPAYGDDPYAPEPCDDGVGTLTYGDVDGYRTGVDA